MKYLIIILAGLSYVCACTNWTESPHSRDLALESSSAAITATRRASLPRMTDQEYMNVHTRLEQMGKNARDVLKQYLELKLSDALDSSYEVCPKSSQGKINNSLSNDDVQKILDISQGDTIRVKFEGSEEIFAIPAAMFIMYHADITNITVDLLRFVSDYEQCFPSESPIYTLEFVPVPYDERGLLSKESTEKKQNFMLWYCGEFSLVPASMICYCLADRDFKSRACYRYLAHEDQESLEASLNTIHARFDQTPYAKFKCTETEDGIMIITLTKSRQEIVQIIEQKINPFLAKPEVETEFLTYIRLQLARQYHHHVPLTRYKISECISEYPGLCPNACKEFIQMYPEICSQLQIHDRSSTN